MSTAAPTRRPGATSLRSRITRFAERATTPLLPADYLDLFDPLRPGAALRGRVEAVQPETADAATVVIRPGADWVGQSRASTSASVSTSTGSGTGVPTR